MPQPIVSQCPFCQAQTEVTEVSCVRCDVQIRGHFALSRFGGLAPDHLLFMETFLRCRGVIRDVEAALGISYPTVRARLDSLLSALGFAAPDEEKTGPNNAGQRKEILAAISAGTMDAETGLDALKKLSE